ncbi:MAG TPA: hypothetical protein V6C65_04450 [Allocoleopsis sp.]
MTDFEDIQTHVAAIAYYLYRLAGCPFGNTLAGYEAWIKIALIEPFDQLCERSFEQENKDEAS